MKSRKFVDLVTLHAQGGRGGNGCMSFRREKFVPKGGPDGGDGGRGGHVILRANQDVTSLVGIYFAPHQRGQEGGHGKGKDLHGRNGKDRIVDVPKGTEIHDAGTGLLLHDLREHGEEFIAAQGGKGGLGNVHWKSSTHQAPTEHTAGDPGEQIDLRLELKIVANVGLVGFPNAGKSSLLSVLSDAHPKIGAYPFTTLNPIIGTVVFDDYTRITVADIPGLIEGAHDGVGLGDAFLRHVERAQFLVYVIDMAGMDGRRPWEDYAALRNELGLYRPDMLERSSLVVANKMDLPEASENIDRFRAETGTEPIRISALEKRHIEDVKAALDALTGETRAASVRRSERAENG